MGVIKQIFFVPLVSQNDGNFGYLSNITFMFAKLLRHMGNMNTIQRNDFFAKSKFSLVDKLTNDTKVKQGYSRIGDIPMRVKLEWYYYPVSSTLSGDFGCRHHHVAPVSMAMENNECIHTVPLMHMVTYRVHIRLLHPKQCLTHPRRTAHRPLIQMMWLMHLPRIPIFREPFEY